MAPPAACRYFAVLPAAGRSVRMGRPKLLLPWNGGTIIESVLRVWRLSQVTQLIVVVHPADHELAEICRVAGANVLVPDTPPPDMKASLQHGLQYIRECFNPQDTDAWLLAPADMPLLTTAAIDQVIAAHGSRQLDQQRIIVPVSGGRRGHPVLFPWSLAAEVDRLPADAGVNRLLKLHEVVEIAADDPSILHDLDTPDDYQQLHNRTF